MLFANVGVGSIAAGGKGLENADAAILSGCSAGGLATYLHCDAFASLVAPTPAKCVADAGYFANIPSLFGAPPVGEDNPRNSIIECVGIVASLTLDQQSPISCHVFASWTTTCQSMDVVCPIGSSTRGCSPIKSRTTVTSE
jgi:hypothetical protein